MNKYIIDFLKQEGRVIIPDFGCLSLSDNGKFVFNSYIKFDDGKLYAYICEQSGADNQDVINKVSAWARELRAQVNTGIDFELVGLGAFYKSGADEIDFRSGTPSHETNEQSVPEQPTPPVEQVPEIEDVPTVSEPTKTDESKHLKNIYIPPVDDVKEEKTTNTSLEDVLGKTETADEEKVEQMSQPQATPEPIAEPESPQEPHPETIIEKVEEVQVEKAPQIQSKTSSDAAKKTDSNKPAAQEVTVNRKRGVFFYINIFLLLLIIGLSVFAYLYTDEISRWLGITTENVLPEPKTNEDSLDASNINQKENTELNVEDAISEIIEETEVVPVDQPIIEQTPAVASGGNFHIIVGTFSIKENADRLVQKIRDAGYDGKILRSTDIGHTVSFHSYNTKEEATNSIGKASEITGTSSYVLKQ